MPNKPNPELSDNMLVVGDIGSQQIIYKLGVIETKMNAMNENFLAALKRFEDLVTTTKIDNEKDLAAINLRIAVAESRMTKMEDWRSQLFTKLGFVVSAISLFWVIFAEPIKHQVEGMF